MNIVAIVLAVGGLLCFFANIMHWRIHHGKLSYFPASGIYLLANIAGFIVLVASMILFISEVIPGNLFLIVLCLYLIATQTYYIYARRKETEDSSTLHR